MSVGLLSVGLLSVGCQKAAEPAPAPAQASPKPAPSPADKTKPRLEEPFVVTAAPLAPGATEARVVVKPTGKWKMNLEYPTRLEVKPPAGVTLARTTLERSDFEVTEAAAAAALSFSGAGGGAIEGVVRFAVCTEETCVPHQADVRWDIADK